MINNPSVAFTVQNDLCLGCGLCSDVCPTDSVHIGIKNGEYRPVINTSSCLNAKGCHKCFSVCPGLGVAIKKIADDRFYGEGGEYNDKVGYYLESYYGCAKNHDTRWHGASGGFLTAFISFLLDNKHISAAVVCENDLSQPFLNKTTLIRKSSDLYKTRSSKYCPVKFEGIIKQIKKETGKVVIVGLPCAIHGFRKYELMDALFRNHIFGYFGIYCSCGRTFNLTDYVFEKQGIDKDSLSYFQYRDEGCLGSLVAKDSRKITKIPFQLYYHPLRSFFIPNRCQFCVDHFAELSDVAFGDVHFGEFKKDLVGLNSLVVRKQIFKDLLLEASIQGYITYDKLSKDDLISSQVAVVNKKKRVGGVLRFCEFLNISTPNYDIKINDSQMIRSVLYFLFAKFQMFIGKRRYLWPIIKIFSKKGRIQ